VLVGRKHRWSCIRRKTRRMEGAEFLGPVKSPTCQRAIVKLDSPRPVSGCPSSACGCGHGKSSNAPAAFGDIEKYRSSHGKVDIERVIEAQRPYVQHGFRSSTTAQCRGVRRAARLLRCSQHWLAYTAGRSRTYALPLATSQARTRSPTSRTSEARVSHINLEPSRSLATIRAECYT